MSVCVYARDEITRRRRRTNEGVRCTTLFVRRLAGCGRRRARRSPAPLRRRRRESIKISAIAHTNTLARARAPCSRSPCATAADAVFARARLQFSAAARLSAMAIFPVEIPRGVTTGQLITIILSTQNYRRTKIVIDNFFIPFAHQVVDGKYSTSRFTAFAKHQQDFVGMLEPWRNRRTQKLKYRHPSRWTNHFV